MFGQYGNIKSIKLETNEFGKYGFVCYEHPDKDNLKYGCECANEAI